MFEEKCWLRSTLPVYQVDSKGRSGRLHHQMRSTLRCCKVNSTSQSVSQNRSHLDEVNSGGHRVDSTKDFSLIKSSPMDIGRHYDQDGAKTQAGQVCQHNPRSVSTLV
ncbi:hypothetical protein Taro_027840 [Colocasia esculenta]|uniref:Uncharacterized protein n=1 Tax=Colocasia esculenta TaxID=4460 RepID=A0A843VFM6_COLES|nr:hypothetical protein [Colocasia esculenta]